MRFRVTGELRIQYAIEVEAKSEEDAMKWTEESADLHDLIEAEIGFDNTAEEAEEIETGEKDPDASKSVADGRGSDV